MIKHPNWTESKTCQDIFTVYRGISITIQVEDLSGKTLGILWFGPRGRTLEYTDLRLSRARAKRLAIHIVDDNAIWRDK